MVTASLPGTLSPGRRAKELDDVVGAAVDVVVVGGGVTGAGVALDAASRGLSVVLLERTDLAAGTSRWFSKLVHGGLRYLAHGEIGLARESARERAVLMGSTAPHLVRRLPFLVPDVAGRDVTALAAAGGRLGDAVRLSVPGGRGSLPSTRRVSADEVSRLVPGVRPGRTPGTSRDASAADTRRVERSDPRPPGTDSRTASPSRPPAAARAVTSRPATSGTRKGSGRTRCGAVTPMRTARSRALSRARPSSPWAR